MVFNGKIENTVNGIKGKIKVLKIEQNTQITDYRQDKEKFSQIFLRKGYMDKHTK